MNIKINKSFGWIIMLALTLSMGSCKDQAAEEADDTDFDEIEQSVLDAWIATNRPELVSSQQEDGYYIEFEDGVTTSGEAIEQGGYISYKITTCDMDGNIYNNRDETMAVQQGVYNRYTRYAAMTDYVPSTSDDIDADEALEYAFMSSELIINGVTTAVEFKAGTKFSLYTRSELAGTVNGLSGYAGQYLHSGYRPVRFDIEVTEVQNYPADTQKDHIDDFIALNSATYPTKDWTLLNSEGAHYIRLNTNYIPIDGTPLQFENEYQYEKLLRDNTVQTDLPQTLAGLKQMITEEVLELYEEDEDDMSDDVIGSSNSSCIWYIARTLDGFIVDSNIEEVQWLIYGTSTSNTSYLYYTADDDEDDYISAWYHAIPNIRYGEWAAFLTTSTNAYSYTGVSASDSSTEIPPHTPLLFEVYIAPVIDYSYYDEDDEDEVDDDE
ncbi:MAG: hypothetical protein SNG14_00505 [Rikenellaceae bacterium]